MKNITKNTELNVLLTFGWIAIMTCIWDEWYSIVPWYLYTTEAFDMLLFGTVVMVLLRPFKSIMFKIGFSILAVITKVLSFVVEKTENR